MQNHRTTQGRLLMLLVVAVALALVGCGSSGSSSQQTVFNANADFNEGTIAREAGFVPSSSGIGYSLDGCSIAVILKSPAEIELYAGAGDTVVTDPTGSFGVKTEDSPRCVSAMQAALARVK